MDNEQTVEAVKQLTWAGYTLMHAPAFGSGGFMMGVFLFLWRWLPNPRAFCCAALGWILFAATLAYFWFSKPDLQHD